MFVHIWYTVFLQAVDPDLNENGRVQYSLSDRDSDNQVLPFTVDSNDGAIYPVREFQRGSKKQYSFTATARDSPVDEDLQQFSDALVYVCFILIEIILSYTKCMPKVEFCIILREN